MASASQDDDDAPKMNDIRGTPHRVIGIMSTYGREFCFLLAVIFTAFAAFQNGPLKTRKANPPSRFFPLSSLVTDFYVGNMQSLSSLLLENDISIVMYYAPWDASCIQARSEFETVARYYHAQVFFAAVNCWWPEGDCRRSLRLQSYPLILAHVRRASSISYNGPLLATYIIPFLDSILSPVYPIHQQGELLDLQAQHEAVLVGYFEFHSSPQPPGYRQYYIAALKTLSRDPSRRLAYAVVTSRQAAVRLRVTAESVVLHQWNQTEVYTEPTIKSDALVIWVYKKINQVCNWISPSGTKSRLMSQVLEKSPTLIFFTPRNLMLGTPPYYDLLREVVMSYFNCESSSSVLSIIHRIVLRRHIRQQDFEKLRESCNPTNFELTIPRGTYAAACCYSDTIALVNSLEPKWQLCFCSFCLHGLAGTQSQSSDFLCRNGTSFAKIKAKIAAGSCENLRFSWVLEKNVFYHVSVKCLTRKTEFAKLSLSEAVSSTLRASGVEDDRVVKMAVAKKKQQCRHLNLALKYSAFNFPATPSASGMSMWQSNFTGLACSTNRTLNFIVMDTILHNTFAEHLGIDIFRMPHHTAAVIVENTQESQYLLTDVTKQNLVQFIKNYTHGTLDRYLRSMSGSYQKFSNEDSSGTTICVKEVMTGTFKDIVLDSQKDVVLMYYAPWCVFCTGISHIFLQVAQFFSGIERITFARINGDLNDLPWEYTVDKYPTILFFPAHRKSDSLEFPGNMPITALNLAQFVLSIAHPTVRWQTAVQMCNGNCHTQNALQSSIQIQDLFLELKALRNQLHHLEDFLFGLAKDERPIKKPPAVLFSGEDFSQWQNLREYRNHLVQMVKEKKQKIRQARELQRLLRKSQVRDLEETGNLRKEFSLLNKKSNVFRARTSSAESNSKAAKDSELATSKSNGKPKKTYSNLAKTKETASQSRFRKMNDEL